jgi:hypothetical protein
MDPNVVAARCALCRRLLRATWKDSCKVLRRNFLHIKSRVFGFASRTKDSGRQDFGLSSCGSGKCGRLPVH